MRSRLQLRYSHLDGAIEIGKPTAETPPLDRIVQLPKFRMWTLQQSQMVPIGNWAHLFARLRPAELPWADWCSRRPHLQRIRGRAP